MRFPSARSLGFAFLCFVAGLTAFLLGGPLFLRHYLGHAIFQPALARSAGPSISTLAGDRRLTLTATADRSFYWNKQGPFPLELLASSLEAEGKVPGIVHVTVATDSPANTATTAVLFDALRLARLPCFIVDPQVRAAH
jgi:hypothetical protein